MTMIAYRQARYATSAAELSALPADEGGEVAFIGRSNAGKSSALNTVTGIKGLARTSKTPGRTQLINVFAISEQCRLIDLPGYGYAKVPAKLKERWALFVNRYLQERASLRGLVVVMDIRHPLKPTDVSLLDWAESIQLPIHVLLTKADKLKYGARQQALMEVSKAIEAWKHVSVQLFSSLDKQGLDDARAKLDEWLQGLGDEKTNRENLR